MRFLLCFYFHNFLGHGTLPTMQQTEKPKIIVIVGPNASGKSGLAIDLAKKFGGEIISADSRQVYRGLNIGTGKVSRREMKGIPHHLLNVANPRRVYTADKYKKDAERAVQNIIQKGKIPIIAGGTGFYIDALLGAVTLPKVPPDQALRKQLEKKSTSQLFKKLQKLDPRRAKAIDSKNKRRLIRAIEIVKAIGKIPKLKKGLSKYEVLYVGIATTEKQLKKNISVRLFARMRAGMIAEARGLHDRGLSWKRMEELGLEYRYLAQFLQKKITKEELHQKIETGNWKYAKRQKTWFRRNKHIKWFTLKETKKIEYTVAQFLNSS